MTTSTRGSIGGAAVGEAGLLATFYLPRDKERVQLLQDRLCRSLDLVRKAPGRYSDLAEEAYLIRFEPRAGSPIAHDTSIIQLALNAPGSADSPWETVREKLEKSIRNAADLDDKSIRDAAERDAKTIWDVIWGAAGLGNIWGYTLTYQAVLNPKVDEDNAFEVLQPTVRRLYSPGNLYALA
jgi:hypothetical protein